MFDMTIYLWAVGLIVGMVILLVIIMGIMIGVSFVVRAIGG